LTAKIEVSVEMVDKCSFAFLHTVYRLCEERQSCRDWRAHWWTSFLCILILLLFLLSAVTMLD